jgi:CRP/FNR family transcriptional regulator/CRP/FNR family cyclic AMP-dependent transcriptional regulator
MAVEDPVALLREVSLFAAIPESELTSLAARLRKRSYRRGDVIMHRGDPAGAMHLLVSGHVKIALPADGEESETVLALLGAGACFGEIAALDGGPRSATVTALEPCATYALLREDLLDFVRGHPDFALALLTTLAGRLRMTNDWLEDAFVQDLDTRLARRLLDLADAHGRETPHGIEVTFPLTQADLAGMLGATRVRVNKLLSAYQSAHLLRLGKGAFTLLQPDALRERAGR